MTKIIRQQCHNSCVAVPFSEKLRQKRFFSTAANFDLLLNNKFPIYILLSLNSLYSAHES